MNIIIIISIAVGMIAGAYGGYRFAINDDYFEGGDTIGIVIATFSGVVLGALSGVTLSATAIYVPIIFFALVIIIFLVAKTEIDRRAKLKKKEAETKASAEAAEAPKEQ